MRVLSLVLALLAAAAAEDYAVSWDAVPASNDGVGVNVPIGCTCFEAGGSTCVKFDCECVCDVTLGACDIGCCCDKDCSSTQVATFTSSGVCVDEGPAPSSVTRCVDLTGFNEFVQVNPRYNLKLETSTNVDQMLCVAVDNNPVEGTFFTDPGTQPAALFQTAQVAAQLVYEQAAPASSSLYTPSDAYTIGSLLLGSTSQFVSIPTPDLGGQCTDGGLIKFGSSVPPESCVVTVPVWSSGACAGLGVEGLPAQTVYAQPGKVNIEDLTLASVRYLDADSGVVGPPLSGPLFFSNFTSSLDNCTCFNAVAQASYVFGYHNFVVTNVSVDLVLVDLPTNNCTAPFAVPVTYSAEFLPTANSSASVRPKSGNPGYIHGAPILAGNLVTNSTANKQAISQHKTGPSGTRDLTRTTSTSVPVSMGVTTTYGCTVKLTLAQLQQACLTWTVPPYVSINASHVGVFGNADPTRVWQWLPITNGSSNPGVGVWTASTHTCTAIPGGLALRFLTADVGELGNPQRKIVSAQAASTLTNWQFTGADPTAPQTFTVTTTISFLYLPTSGTDTFEPGLPPSFPKLPHDLFYPFSLGNS